MRTSLRSMAVIAASFFAAGLSSSAWANDPAPQDASSTWIRPMMLGDSIGNPAEEHPRDNQPAQPAQSAFGSQIVHPWELQPVNVVANQPREDQQVGSYGQPVWTTDRRFAETRVYVRPEGSFEFEYWLIPHVQRKGPSEIDSQFEVELGLPHRFQLDLYLTNIYEKDGGDTLTNGAIELRYAFADWGKIWGNPTFYIEFTKQDNGPDELEMKMLFGGNLAPGWHWGFDLTYQHDMGADNANTYEATGGISYAIVDSKFDIGAEMKIQENDFRGDRHLRDNFLIGPSFQYRPLPQMHIDLTPLIGITHESEAAEVYLIIGWDF